MVTKAPNLVWTNWAKTYSCQPSAIDTPAGEEQIIASVRSAYSADEKVKVVGSGHSFTDIACTRGRMISLTQHNRVLDIDTSTGLVKVEAGIPLQKLNDELALSGLAMQNLGDIAYQSIAGAISTATHGTGVRFGGLATQVQGLELITADGTKIACSEDDRPEVFNCARVSLGALGVISSVTLQCVPAFNLHAVDFPMKLDNCLAQLHELVESNDHFEFWWFPHTDGAYVRTNNRTEEPRASKRRSREWFEDVFLSNYVFELSCRVGRKWPATIPRLNRVANGVLGGVDLIDRSDRVFTSPRLVKFSEMEYAIPRSAAADALREIRHTIDQRGFRVSIFVEVRFVAADDIPLSTAFGRETAYIAVHMFEGTEYHSYFRAVEEIMDDYQGRPHWGKIHYQTAETLRYRYPEWDRFLAVRDVCDPERRFSNLYLDRVLGDMPITSSS